MMFFLFVVQEKKRELQVVEALCSSMYSYGHASGWSRINIMLSITSTRGFETAKQAQGCLTLSRGLSSTISC